MKKYSFEFLYDNGVKESIRSNEMTDEQLTEFLVVVYQSFRHSGGVLRIPDEQGDITIIDAGKVVRMKSRVIGDEFLSS